MTTDADYARAVAYLDKTRLPAYVSFIEKTAARGLGDDREAPRRLYVRMPDGVIVRGTPPGEVHVVGTNNGDSDNPFRKERMYEPRCYTPTSETRTQLHGSPALRFALQSACTDTMDFTELYADPETLRPIAVDGNVADTDGSHMTTASEVRYATVGPYTVPSGLSAHAVGHGWLFWARERVEVTYTDYRFFEAAKFNRRQASEP